MKKIKSIEKLLEKAEGKSWFSDQFHNASQNKSVKKPDIKNIPQSWIRIHFKTYPRFKKIPLSKISLKDNSLNAFIRSRRSVREISGGEKWIIKAAIIFILTGVLDRTRIKYGDRGYRYTLIEAGHLGQNICLIAAELGLVSCPIGGYIDDKVDHLLDIDLQKEVTLYLIAVGRI